MKNFLNLLFVCLLVNTTVLSQNIIDVSPKRAEVGQTFTIKIVAANTHFTSGNNVVKIATTASGINNIFNSAIINNYNAISDTVLAIDLTLPNGVWAYVYPIAVEIQVSNNVDGTMLFNTSFLTVKNQLTLSHEIVTQGDSVQMTISGNSFSYYTTPGITVKIKHENYLRSTPALINVTDFTILNDSTLTARFKLPIEDSLKSTLQVCLEYGNMLDYNVLQLKKYRYINQIGPKFWQDKDSVQFTIKGHNTKFTSSGLKVIFVNKKNEPTDTIKAQNVKVLNDSTLEIVGYTKVGEWNIHLYTDDDKWIRNTELFSVGVPSIEINSFHHFPGDQNITVNIYTNVYYDYTTAIDSILLVDINDNNVVIPIDSFKIENPLFPGGSKYISTVISLDSNATIGNYFVKLIDSNGRAFESSKQEQNQFQVHTLLSTIITAHSGYINPVSEHNQQVLTIDGINFSNAVDSVVLVYVSPLSIENRIKTMDFTIISSAQMTASFKNSDLSTWGGYELRVYQHSSYVTHHEEVQVNPPISVIKHAEQTEILAYPNPCTKTLFINDIQGRNPLTIFEIDGSIVLNLPELSSNNIDVSSLSPGLYVLSYKGKHMTFLKR